MTTVIDSFTGRWHDLSNFAMHPCRIGTTTYPSVEHGMHALKIEDPKMRARLYASAGDGRGGDLLTPAEIKAWGQTVPLRRGWDEGIATAVVALLLASKFTSPGPQGTLLATQHAVLVEGNRHHDQRWGDCRCGRASCASTGRNQLGILLMGIREGILAGQVRP